ncbi:hypothetical protein YSY43_31210 [Paenibacillus sp. YSY-4.3]
MKAWIIDTIHIVKTMLAPTPEPDIINAPISSPRYINPKFRQTRFFTLIPAYRKATKLVSPRGTKVAAIHQLAAIPEG